MKINIQGNLVIEKSAIGALNASNFTIDVAGDVLVVGEITDKPSDNSSKAWHPFRPFDPNDLPAVGDEIELLRHDSILQAKVREVDRLDSVAPVALVNHTWIDIEEYTAWRPT